MIQINKGDDDQGNAEDEVDQGRPLDAEVGRSDHGKQPGEQFNQRVAY
jgi:hypothetical protein